MRVNRLWPSLPGLLTAAAILVGASGAILAQATADVPSTEDIDVLHKQIATLREKGEYGQAFDIAQRSLALAESTFGLDHPMVGTSLNHLGGLHQTLGRFDEAERNLKRALRVREAALGPDHGAVGTTLDNLGLLYRAQGRYAEAEPLLTRGLAVREKSLGPDHFEVAVSLNSLALLYRSLGRFNAAEPLFKQALTINEKARGAEHRWNATPLDNLGWLFSEQGRHAEAEPLYKRALAIREKELGPEHPDIAAPLNNLAALYRAQGRYGEAEPHFKRVLAVLEKAFGSAHPSIATALNNLAALLHQQGRLAEAEELFKRALIVRETALGSNHPDLALSLNNLASLYRAQRRHNEAEPLFQQALAISEKAFGPDHPSVGTWLNNLADLYRAQRRYGEAEPLLHRALAISEKALGRDHPSVAASITNLAALYRVQDRHGEAEPLFKRALVINETAFGQEHPAVANAHNSLGLLYHAQQDWSRAADAWRRSSAIIVQRTRRGANVPGESMTGAGRTEAERSRSHFTGLVKAAHRLVPDGRSADAGLAAEMFTAAQWAQSSQAARSLAQMAARGAKDDPTLGRLVRDRQDYVAEWQVLDGRRTRAVSQPPDQRDRADEAAHAARLAVIDAAVRTIDQRMAAEFSDYAALASPDPLTIAQVRAVLRPDEALVIFMDTQERAPLPEESFVWVVTNTDLRWLRSDLGTKTLTREVAALRCGLDVTVWTDPSGWPETTPQERQQKTTQASRRQNCLEVAGLSSAPFGALPFDAARAHALYKSLFGGVDDLLKGKHLLLVPSGPLSQLPFHVLLTRPPAGNALADHAWFGREHALTVLPAVSSLQALRRIARPSVAAKSMIGFGNPLLDGPDASFAARAMLARGAQTCPENASPRPAPIAQRRAAVGGLQTRGGLADITYLQRQLPLPETVGELCDVARLLGADVRDVWLGAQATEAHIKRLSAAQGDERLANYRFLHFATHGFVASQIDGSNEPGLVLTPPMAATVDDDGYLTASEIAGLKLDADWIILSACNTAGSGSAGGGEALSGLARAFFYAGARALLVSHWEVDSAATVALVTKTFAALAAEPGIGRAAALRRAMAELIDGGGDEAHPSFWAPFVVTGEGGNAR